MPECSVVIPLYNEEESLPVLWEQLRQAMSRLSLAYEVIFVNDGSDDRSPQILRQWEEKYSSLVRVIHLAQRKGQTRALKKGFDISQGDIVITLDADLQNDPADIPALVMKIQEGYDVVCGWRKDRKDKPLKALLSRIGNVFQRLFTGMSIHDVSCTLRAYRRECAMRIPLNWEGQHRFIPLSLSLQGFKVGEIISHHRARSFGKSKYHHKRIFKVVADFFKVLLARGKY